MATIVSIVCLRFVFLLVMRMCSWLRLSRREEPWKSAEILLLRHQLTVLARQQPARPNMTWADRAWFAVLLSAVPHPRRASLKLFVTPQTVLRRHRDIVRRRWALKSEHRRPVGFQKSAQRSELAGSSLERRARRRCVGRQGLRKVDQGAVATPHRCVFRGPAIRAGIRRIRRRSGAIGRRVA